MLKHGNCYGIWTILYWNSGKKLKLGVKLVHTSLKFSRTVSGLTESLMATPDDNIFYLCDQDKNKLIWSHKKKSNARD